MPKATQLNNKKSLDQRLLPLTYSKADKQKSVESLYIFGEGIISLFHFHNHNPIVYML